MPHGDLIETKGFGEFLEGIEFDVFVAEDIWVWGTAFLVFIEEVRKDVIPIFFDEIRDGV
jgi:hypothetical protein